MSATTNSTMNTAVNPAVNPYWQILMQPVRERRNAGSLWLSWVLIACGLASAIIFSVFSHGLKVAFFATNTFLVMLITMWGWMLTRSLVAQNTPINAVLVPGLRKRLMQTMLLPWLAMPLALASALWFTSFPFELTFLLGLLGVMLVSLAMRFVWLRFLPLAWVVCNAMLLQILPSPSQALAMVGHGPAVAICLCIDLALLVFALRALFPAGGEMHVQWHAGLERAAQAIKTGKLSVTARQPNPVGWLYSLGYRSSLQRDCDDQAPAGRLILYVFGVECHWSGLLFVPCMFLLSAIALGLWGGLRADNVYIPIIVCLVLLYMMLPVMMFVVSLYHAMRRTETEQALLRLAPAMPQGQALNRMLGQALLKRLLPAWAASALGGVLALLAAGIDSGYVAFSLGGSFASLLVAGFVLADFAALNESRAALVRVITIAVPMLLTGAFFGVRVFWFALPVMAFGAVCVALSALIIAVRWRGMLR
ncbi:hypothetical protein, partial [Undibacterium sp.]|uniref:hypothetical protein n=1 Tax=Undibacterium sp. TaxID=1914977 RepID=UPI00374D8596